MRWIIGAALIGAGAITVSAVLPRPAPPAQAVQPPRDGTRIAYTAGRYPVLQLPDGTNRQVRSMLNTARPMRFGDYLWHDRGISPGPVWIRVDLTRQIISVFRAGHEIGSAVILYGAEAKPTPSGVYPVLEKARVHRSSLYDADMPFTLRLTGDGIAIHASRVRADAATHGCIGVPAGFAQLLFDQVQRGDPVAIVRS